MSNRSWFFAANGQQQGPYQEAQFRDLIARGSITAQTMVWSEGMTGWQKAVDVPGLMARAAAPPPPMVSQPGGAMMSTAGYGGGSGVLSIDFGIWDFVWRSFVLLLGMILIIPTPWVIRWYTNWFVSCVRVPGRPNLSFTGTVGTIALWYFVPIVILIVLGVIAAAANSSAISNVGNLVQVVLYWLFLRYVIAHLASNGQSLGLSFSGSFWAYLGYSLLMVLAIVTIIGWAWVLAAFVRWYCRNIQGTRRAVVFKGTGLEFLWRSILYTLGCLFIIPIPWVVRWMLRWQASQTELIERSEYAGA